MEPEELLKHLKELPSYEGQLVHKESINGRLMDAVSFESINLESDIVNALKGKGINTLYRHQAEAVKYLSLGKSVVICTSTASGKSLCYLIPIFRSILKDQRSTALLVFPTKALAQDQLRTIRQMAYAVGGSCLAQSIHVYDGDTPDHERFVKVECFTYSPYLLYHMTHFCTNPSRVNIRQSASIILSNPDMLHCSILPLHRQFSDFCRHLKYCVIDEAHMYRGVFGSHVAFVMRRLRRICAQYCSSPIFALTTATVANPKQHAIKVTGLGDIYLIEKDGSPHGSKLFALWNPPLLEANVLAGKRKMKLIEQENKRRLKREARQERHFSQNLGDNGSVEQWKDSVGIGLTEFSLRQKLAKNAKSAISEAIVQGSNGSLSNNHNEKCVLKEEKNARMPSRSEWRAKLDQVIPSSPSRRRSPIVEISFLLSECVKHGLRTIAFCKTRKLSELVATYTREILAPTNPLLLEKIAVYRAGYSSIERRQLERSIFCGEVLGIAATNALELGVDIGGLDCTLHLGFPGSVASLWQQAGRAGRRNQRSLSIYIGWESPMDQYFMRLPSELFSRPIEEAHIDLTNPEIQKCHLMCAAHEIPLVAERDASFFNNSLRDIVKTLVSSGQISRGPLAGTMVYCGQESFPARVISLRDIDNDKYTVLDESSGMKVLEEIEGRKAFFSIYDGAVFISQSKTYICKSLDLHSKVAVVRPADVKYYTTTIDYTDVHVVGAHNLYISKVERHNEVRNEGRASTSGNIFPTTATVGKAVITTRWMGYARIWRGSGQVFDVVDLFLPDVMYETVAVSLRLPSIARRMVAEQQGSFREGVHGAVHAIMNVIPLFVTSNPEDLATECDNQYDTRFKPERLLVFDRHAGGIGLSQAVR